MLSINAGTNSAVSTEVTDALYYGSDHLPVFCDFEFSPASGLGDSSYHIPDKYRSYSNFPNPFNPDTVIEYELPQSCQVELVVYDLNGSVVRTITSGVQNVGKHSVRFDGSELASGIYFYQLNAGEFRGVKRMLLTK